MSSPLLNMLRSKFRGCLHGALLGDCFGCPFEGEATVGKLFLTNYLHKISHENEKSQFSNYVHAPISNIVTRMVEFHLYSYTDDTAMTISVADSLIECTKFDAADMARRFTEEFLRYPNRGYGTAVKDTFLALRESDYENVFEPAKHQFKGSGSLGNGAAMRVSPVGLFAYGLSNDELIELARNQSLITHTNPHGYNGAILQALAVNQALLFNLKQSEDCDSKEFDTGAFLDTLIHEMEVIEEKSPSAKESNRLSKENIGPTPYTDSLKKMKAVLSDLSLGKDDMSSEQVVSAFGNRVSAHKSVPTAIYAALRAHKPIANFETDNQFLRTLFLSISFGGDTDTIGSMACSIAGALYGHDLINPILIKRCEANERITQMADRLLECVTKRNESPLAN